MTAAHTFGRAILLVLMFGSTDVDKSLMLASAVAAPRLLEYSAEQLTKEASTQFPQQRCVGGIACITLSNPAVRMKVDEPRLYMRVRAVPQLGVQPFAAGVIEVAARPRYRSEDGAFYLEEPVFTQFEFPGLDAGAADTIALSLRPAITEVLSTTPVWALDESDPQQAMLRIVLQDVSVVQGKLRLTIGR